jgi:hypothetical protein
MTRRLAQHPQKTCRTYLLKIWQEEDQGILPEREWRFSLEDVKAGIRRGFHDLDSLAVFLQDLTRHPENPADWAK